MCTNLFYWGGYIFHPVLATGYLQFSLFKKNYLDVFSLKSFNFKVVGTELCCNMSYARCDTGNQIIVDNKQIIGFLVKN